MAHSARFAMSVFDQTSRTMLKVPNIIWSDKKWVDITMVDMTIMGAGEGGNLSLDNLTTKARYSIAALSGSPSLTC